MRETKERPAGPIRRVGLGTRALSLDDSPPRMHSYGSSTQNPDPDPQPPRNSILYRDKTCSADEVTHSKLHRLSDSDSARTQTPFLFSPLSGPHVCMSSSFHKAEMENPVPYNSTAAPQTARRRLEVRYEYRCTGTYTAVQVQLYRYSCTGASRGMRPGRRQGLSWAK